jgi:hypothetical protein
MIIIYRAKSAEEYHHLIDAGATVVVSDEREASFRLAGNLLYDLGLQTTQINSMKQDIGEYLDQQEELMYQRKQVKKRTNYYTPEINFPFLNTNRETNRKSINNNTIRNQQQQQKLYNDDNNAVIDNARRNLEKIINSVKSLSEEYIWVSDDEVKSILQSSTQPSSSSSYDSTRKGRSTVLSAVTRDLKNAPKSSISSSSDDSSTSSEYSSGSSSEYSSGNTDMDDSVFDDKITQLGVTLCAMPPKQDKKNDDGNNDDDNYDLTVGTK